MPDGPRRGGVLLQEGQQARNTAEIWNLELVVGQMNPSGIDANESLAHRSSGLPLKYLQRYALAVVSIGVALGISLLLQHFGFRVPSTLLLLFAVAISSWYGGLGPAVLAVVLSTISFYWYFVEPVRTIYIYRSEIPYFVIFTAFAALLSWFGTVRRRAEADLREQAALLNLTHDTVFAMDMEGVIKYWNRGAEERYGWTADQAVGRVVHDLLKTVFPAPLDEIKAEVTRAGRWEGELLHTKKDGSQLVVASRWALQRNNKGAPVAILETNNDITERKHAEEALRRLNRELRALSNCNQTLLRATDEQSLLEEICRIVCQEAGYRTAWVAYAEHDEAKSVRPAAWTGTEEGFLANLGITWADTERGCGPTGTAIRSGKTCCILDFATDPRLAPWRESALQRDFRSGIALPLKDEHANAFGSLTIYSALPNAFTSEEIRLLEELAADLAFGIVTLRSQAARQQAEEALRQSEFYLAEAQRVSHTGSWYLDVVHNRLSWSDEVFRIFGIQFGTPLTYETFLAAVHTDDRAFVDQAWKKALLGAAYDIEHRILVGREVRWVRERARLEFDADGRATKGIGTVQDITEGKRAEETLRESETRFRTLFEKANDAIFLENERDEIIEVNQRACALLGYSREELLTMKVSDLQAPEIRGGVGSVVRGEMEKHGGGTFEAVDLHRSGRRIAIEVSNTPISDRGQELVLSIVRDITERKRAEEEVRNTAAQWQATFDAVQDSVLLLDKDFRVLRANHATAELLGQPFDKIVGGYCYDLTHGTSTPPAGCPLAKMRQSRRHEEAEVLARKGGPWLSVSVDPLFDPSGELTQVVHVARDITERKRAEEALRRSQYYLAEAEKLTHTGSWARDPRTGKVLYWSEESFRLLGLDPAQGIPDEDVTARLMHPEDRDRVIELRARALRDKSAFMTDYRIVLPDGTLKHLHVIAHPTFDEAGEVAEYLGTAMDITERKRAEEALRRSEAYLKEAQRLSHTGSWALDVASGNYVYSSEEYLRISGFDPQQGLPTKDQPLQQIHPDDLDKFWQAFQKLIDEKVDSEGEYRIVLPDGTVKYVHAIRHPVLNANGELVEIVGTTVDITERKRAEEALRRSEAYLAEAQRLTHTGSFAYDGRTNTFPYWSEEHFRIWGFDPRQGPPDGETLLQRVHPEDREMVRELSVKALRERRDYTAEYRIVLPDGTVKHIEAIGHLVSAERGGPIEVIGTHVDVTARKRAEQALREGETRFRTFVDHAGDALFVQDFEQGTIVDVNRSACESLGYTRQELIGNREVAFHLDADRAEMESAAERVAAGETVVGTHCHRRKDGTVFPVEANTSSFWYGGRRFLLHVSRDITDRKRAEEQREKLRQLEADLAHIDRVSILGELTASIAHEINQPLSGVVSSGSACLRWLARDVPDLEEAREAARRIVRDGKRAGEIIARIRALTKKAVASKEKLNLNETIREVLALVGDEAKRNTVVIRTRFGDDVFPVLGDQVQLQQVVLNLVMNAIEAMSSVGDRARELMITTRNIDPDQVQVTVEDSGTGIDPQMIDKIFGSFYTTKPGGMGMGLSISRSILQAHGGRLWATAKDGGGTIFHFTLPKYHEEESNAGVAAV